MSITTTPVVIIFKRIIDIEKQKTPHHKDTGFVFNKLDCKLIG